MKTRLQKIYQIRFSGLENYRKSIWKILVQKYFSQWIQEGSTVLDLGCGYGEFINNIEGCKNHAMDLNPNTSKFLENNIVFHKQDCSESWSLEPESIDLIFTSNFFEHLPDKQALDRTISNAKLALKEGGRIIAMGPNISVLKGRYWDFWDHHVALSEQSLAELFEIHDMEIETSIARFLPYNMVRVKRRPIFLVYLYLKIPLFWPFFGKQFLIIARKKSQVVQ